MSEEWTRKAVGNLQTHAQQRREDKEQSHLATFEELEGIQTQTLNKRNLGFLLL